jgi:hypothetical protein
MTILDLISREHLASLYSILRYIRLAHYELMFFISQYSPALHVSAHIYLASLVIMLPKKLKNSTFPSRFWFLVICTRDGSLEILITSDFPNYLRNKLAKKEKKFVR